jgi:pyruvate dehydrogenase E2 component (dihydrolipoamide acetyltransferase)
MAEAILMPRLSDTMTEGVIASWHKKVGDTVKKGDVLADVETDKATMELESYKDGTVLYIGVKDGEKLNVDDLLLIVGKEGEDYQSLLNGKSGGQSKEAPVESGGDDNKRQPEQNGLQDQEQDTKVAGDGQTPEGKPAPAATNNGAAKSLDLASMEEVVLMPRLSDTMTEGVIAGWQKNVGDTVKKGDVLADIETDKATMELESYKDGKLLYQGAKAGEKIQVNDLLCIIGAEGFDINPIIAAAKGGGNTAPAEADKATTNTAPEESSRTQDATPAAKTETAAPAEQKVINEGRIFASPLAKKLAEEKGIDLKYVKGSGDNGRITKSDIDGYKAPAPQPTTAPATTPDQKAPATQPAKTAVPAAPAGQESFEEVAVSQMRKTIARRLSESLFTAPHFYVTMSIDMDAAVAARVKLNETSPVKISFNDLVLKAVAVALKQHPKVNSSWLGEKIRTNYHVNIGVAVAVDEGLLVPVVRFADTKSLSQISNEVKDFAKKAKDKKLQPADWEGSTFTISNLGMFGVDEFTAIINQPNACILAVSGIAQVPVVKGGQIVPGNVMKVTLSCDHRVVDGATGAAFLQTVKSLLEEPLRMMI